MQSPFIPIDSGSLHFPSKRGIPTTERWERGWFTYYPRITFFLHFLVLFDNSVERVDMGLFLNGPF